MITETSTSSDVVTVEATAATYGGNVLEIRSSHDTDTGNVLILQSASNTLLHVRSATAAPAFWQRELSVCPTLTFRPLQMGTQKYIKVA